MRVRHHHHLTTIIIITTISFLLLLFGRRSSDRTEAAAAAAGFSCSPRSFVSDVVRFHHRQRVWNDDDERRVGVVSISSSRIVAIIIIGIFFLIFFFSSQTSSEDERLEKANLPVDEDHLHTREREKKHPFWQRQHVNRFDGKSANTKKRTRRTTATMILSPSFYFFLSLSSFLRRESTPGTLTRFA